MLPVPVGLLPRRGSSPRPSCGTLPRFDQLGRFAKVGLFARGRKWGHPFRRALINRKNVVRRGFFSFASGSANGLKPSCWLDPNLRFRRLNRNTGRASARRGDSFSQPAGSSARRAGALPALISNRKERTGSLRPGLPPARFSWSTIQLPHPADFGQRVH